MVATEVALLLGGIALFIGYQIAWGKANGRGKGRTWWCEDERAFPVATARYEVSAGKADIPYHPGPIPGTLMMFRPTGFRGRKQEPVVFDADDFEIQPAPRNKRATHPLFRRPTIRIGIKRRNEERDVMLQKLRIENAQQKASATRWQVFGLEHAKATRKVIDEQVKLAADLNKAHAQGYVPNKNKNKSSSSSGGNR